MANKDKRTSGRLLGAAEAMYAAGVELLGGSILFQMGVIDTSHELSQDVVKEAGNILASRQESLRLKICKTDQSPGFRFEPLENWEDVNVRLANINDKDDWVNIVNEEQDRRFDFVNGPFWGIILAKVNETILDSPFQNRYVIMLKVHHSIGDAKSIFDALYRQFLPILSAVINKGDLNDVLSEDIPLQKSVEEVLAPTPLPWFMKQIMNVVMWFKGKYSKPATYSFVYKEDPERTKEEIAACPGYYPFAFSEKLTANVLKAAKQHNVSVHSVLTGVISVGLCVTSDDAGVILPKTLNIMWPVDVRKFLGIKSPQPLCAYSGNGTSVTKKKSNYTEEEFWKMCTGISKGVKSQNTKEKCSFGIRAMNHLIGKNSNDWNGFLEKLSEFGFECVGIISNLGNCNNGPEPIVTKGEVEIKLQEAHFAVTGSRDMEMFPFFYAVTTFNGKIMVNVHYCPKVVSKRFVTNLSMKLQEVAEQYCVPQDTRG